MEIFKLVFDGHLGWICWLTKNHKWERFRVLDIEPPPIDPRSVSWGGKRCWRCDKEVWD